MRVRVRTGVLSFSNYRNFNLFMGILFGFHAVIGFDVFHDYLVHIVLHNLCFRHAAKGC
jgi:hypothetical protein